MLLALTHHITDISDTVLNVDHIQVLTSLSGDQQSQPEVKKFKSIAAGVFDYKAAEKVDDVAFRG